MNQDRSNIYKEIELIFGSILDLTLSHPYGSKFVALKLIKIE